jgi:2,3-bisphosphoglycerate-independent phosphoglycerate mutase
VISAATLITGIGKVVGLEHIPVTGATGSADSNLAGKLRRHSASWTGILSSS